MSGRPPRCPVCETESRDPPFLSRRGTPALLNYPCSDLEAARSAPRGDLEFYACRECGFLWNRAFDPGLCAYDDGYVNDQSCSGIFAEYLHDTVRGLVEDEGLRGAHIVEVGCGQGDFLRLLASYPGSGITGVGFDPAYRGPPEFRVGENSPVALRFFAAPACGSLLPVKAAAVISRHVVEHIGNPREFVAGISTLLGAGGRLYLETPSAEWILRNHASWDFFHEHCSLFSVGALVGLVESSGFAVRTLEHRFGGQYLWLSAERSPGGGALAASFRREDEKWRRKTALTLAGLAKKGGVALWGAGAKGVAFANEFDPDRRLIAVAVDINPAKQGLFIPVSGHRIVSPEALHEFGIAAVVVLNPNYIGEISNHVKALHLQCEVVDLSKGIP